MARLLYDALSEGIALDYVQKILAAFPDSEPEKDAVAQSSPLTSEFIEPLSDRELEVLQLVADGLSRPEIANKLVLSLNTIKTHTRNIYSKLGVNNQMQAVGKARALGILQDG
jgi:LuxR family maltose regulon positive regulatory protein